MHPLTNILVKTSRSFEHLKTLDTEVTNFLKGCPYEVVSKLDSEKRAYTYRVHTRQDVPMAIRLLAGEVITHLRSALDHLAWQLALIEGTPNESTEFPIFAESIKYRKKRWKIRSLSQQAQVIIEGLQPYTEPKPFEHPLWILHKLANVDKHRLITVVGGSQMGISVEWLADGMSIQGRVGPFDDQTEIGRLDFSETAHTPNPQMETQVGGRFMFNLCLTIDGDTAIRAVVPTLYMLGTNVEMVIRKFVGFFPPMDVGSNAVSG